MYKSNSNLSSNIEKSIFTEFISNLAYNNNKLFNIKAFQFSKNFKKIKKPYALYVLLILLIIVDNKIQYFHLFKVLFLIINRFFFKIFYLLYFYFINGSTVFFACKSCQIVLSK